jgi:hypothetical protein
MPDLVETTLDSHFAGKEPAVRALYDALLARLRELGPVTEEPKKTCIHLVHRTALAGAYPRREYLNLEFKTDYPIASERIAKSERVSRNRYHHTLHLASTAELDDEVLGWLRDAYTLSS